MPDGTRCCLRALQEQTSDLRITVDGVSLPLGRRNVLVAQSEHHISQARWIFPVDFDIFGRFTFGESFVLVMSLGHKGHSATYFYPTLAPPFQNMTVGNAVCFFPPKGSPSKRNGLRPSQEGGRSRIRNNAGEVYISLRLKLAVSCPAIDQMRVGWESKGAPKFLGFHQKGRLKKTHPCLVVSNSGSTKDPSGRSFHLESQ